jgi:type II secretory ATPase GspE/PulE/Tfp pilus assembly ATPase PilB-like protein
MNEKIRDLIQEQMAIGELRKKTKGMFASLRLNGVRKILSGETSMDEIFKIIY